MSDLQEAKTSRSRKRLWLMRLVSAALGLAFTVLVLEIALRLLPVPTGMRTQPVSAQTPVFRFKANRDYVFSTGWDFKLANRGHVNNAGYVSDIDYVERTDHTVLAVVGDSYMEALMVPWSETMTARLNTGLSCDQRVYVFAASGAPLSQYLVWAKHARERYGASGVVITVVGNDFDESHMSVKQGPGFHHFRESEEGLRLTRVDYEPSWRRDVATATALGRYLIFSLRIQHAIASLKSTWQTSGASQDAPYVGNTAAKAGERRMQVSRASVDAFVDQVQTYAGYDPSEVLIVVDGIRPIGQVEDIESVLKESYFGQMRSYLLRAAASAGFEVVDMQDVFSAIHAKEGGRFEFDNDSHWNGRAHRVAADTVRDTALFSKIFPARAGRNDDCE